MSLGSSVRMVVACSLLAAAPACSSRVDLLPAVDGPGTITLLDVPESSRGLAGGDDGAAPELGVGWWPSIAVDQTGGLHVAYCDAGIGDLKYLHRPAGTESWLLEMVDEDGATGKYATMAVDATGSPHFVYHQQDNKELRYARRAEGGSGFTIETIDNGLEIGMAANLAIAPDGTPHVLYYSAKPSLKRAWRTEAGWQREVVAEVGGAASLDIGAAFDSQGVLHVAYSDWQMLNSTFHYGRRTPDGSWQHEMVADTKQPGWKSSLALRNDQPVISYITLRDGQLFVAERRNGDWKTRLVANNVSSHQLAVSSANRLVVAMEQTRIRASADGALVVLVEQADGRFAQYRADTDRPVAKYLALALTRDDQPVVAYFDGRRKALKLYEQ